MNRRKIMSGILIGSILATSIPLNVMAKSGQYNQSIGIEVNNDFNLTEDEVREILRDYGMEEKDIDNLINEFPLTNENIEHGTLSFYSTPKKGEVKYITYTYDRDEFVRIAKSLKIAATTTAVGLGT